MLASTIQFSNNKQTPDNPHPPGVHHHPASSLRHPPTGGSPRTQQRATAPTSQPPEPVPHPKEAVLDTRTTNRQKLGQCLPQFSHPAPHTTLGCERGRPPTRDGDGAQRLPRKEVIQPHLPVRLPCYDFVPIADPTFDGSLHKG